jgi:hypothetical protein
MPENVGQAENAIIMGKEITAARDFPSEEISQCFDIDSEKG